MGQQAQKVRKYLLDWRRNQQVFTILEDSAESKEQMRRSWRRRQERERERVLNKRRKTERLSKINLWKMENQEKVKGYKNNPCLHLFQALKNALAKDAQFSTYKNTCGKWIAKCSAASYKAIGLGQTEGEAKNRAAWKILLMMETDKYSKTPLTFG